MARNDIIARLYARKGSALDFNFDALQAPPLASLIPIRDIEYMNKLVTSIKYTSKMSYKESEIKKVMNYYGFVRYASGTHRVVYRHLDIPTIITKISLNKTSLGDNIREMHNQQYLKPFCTKVFDVYPTGVIGLFERVEPFQSREEFASVAGDIFDFINTKIIGKYVVDDIGTSSFMNYGIRKAGPYSNISFGPVLLDFTEVFPLDGAKLYCNKVDPNTGIICGGTLDYDEGFNLIRCNKCGKIYEARELQRSIENHEVIKKGKAENMEMIIRRGDTVVRNISSNNMPTNTIEPPKKKHKDTGITGRHHASNKRVITIDPHASDKNNENAVKNVFCGGYVHKKTEEEKFSEKMDEIVKNCIEAEPVETDRNEIRKNRFSYIPENETPEEREARLDAERRIQERFKRDDVSGKPVETDRNKYDTDTGFIPKQEETTKEEATEPVESEELGGEDAESELGGYSSEPAEPEDELGGNVSVDPAAIAAAMMSGVASGERNPFAK